MDFPVAVAKRQQINTAIADAMKEFAPSVQRINYEVGREWTGEWALFFKVLLSDEASQQRNLRDVAPKLESYMLDRVDIPTLGLYPYFDFRSQAEQAEVNDPAWA